MDKKKRSSFIRKMKNRFRSYIITVLAVGMVLSNITVPTQAAGGNVTEDFPAEIQNWHRLQGEGIPAFLKVDGEVAWCIEPGKLAHVGQNNEYTMDTHFQVGRDSIKGAVELRGNGELIKREAIDDIGGWNNYTIVDDLDMSTRLHIKGWDIRFCPDAIVYEEGIMYIRPLYRQRRRWLEGTIRRYLEYAGDVLFSKDMSLRASLDMTAYITQFIMPGWFLMEILIRGFKVLAKQAPPHMLYSSIFIGCIIGFGFFFAARYALRRYDYMPRLDATFEALETSVYLFIIWFPLVLYICFKILFMKKDMNWGKTAHGLVMEEEASIKAFIKKELEKTKQYTREYTEKYTEKLKQILAEKTEMLSVNSHTNTNNYAEKGENNDNTNNY